MKPQKILVLAEDSTCQMIRRELENRFIPLLSFASTLVDFEAGFSPPPDLLVVDSTIGETTTQKAMKCIQEKNYQDPCIILTEQKLKSQDHNSLLKTNTVYLLKSQISELGQMIESILAEPFIGTDALSNGREHTLNENPAVVQSELERMNSLAENLPVGIYRADKNGFILFSNAVFKRLVNIVEPISQPLSMEKVYRDSVKWKNHLEKLQYSHAVWDVIRLTKENKSIWLKDAARAIFDDQSEILYIDGILEDITEVTNYIFTFQEISQRDQTDHMIKQRNRELALLNEVITSAASSMDYRVILQTVLRELAEIFGLGQAGAMLLDGTGTNLILEAEYSKIYSSNNLGVKIPLQQNTASRYVIENKKPLMIEDAQNDPRMESVRELMKLRNIASILILPIEVQGKILGTIGFDSFIPRKFTDEEIRLAENSIKAASQAIGNIQLFEEIRQRANELEAVSKVSLALRSASNRDEMLPILIDLLTELMRTEAIAFITDRSGRKGKYCELANGEWSKLSGLHLTEYSDETEKAVIFTWVKYELDRGFPLGLIIQDELLGELRLLRSNPFTDNEKRLLMAVADIVANAMQRALLHESTIKRMQRISILHNIDVAISASFDIRGIINVVIDQIVSKLGVDAADLLLFETSTFTFQMASNRGFRNIPSRKQITATDGRMAELALSRKPVTILDLSLENDFIQQRDFRKEGFVSYHSVPLVAKGEYKGVLEVFQRKTFQPDLEWLEFLETIGGQAAIAIDNVSILNTLQRTNFEINFAFDLALENMAKMLEECGYEPEGHIRRILDKTVILSKHMGMHDDEIPHIRRGVLLHDIGKFIVPDYIQLKPGTLNEHEWKFVRSHASYGNEAFSSVSFLRPALEIPYCHHEKWDGKGYPRGLSGVEIPLSARIFTVIDVWDCLTHNRPYRKAWSDQSVMEYLKMNAGSHFDSTVVDAYLGLFYKNNDEN